MDEPAAAAEPKPEADAAPEVDRAPAEMPPPAEATAPPTSAWVPPPAYPPPAPARAATVAGSSSGLALGLVLVVVGIFFLIMRLFSVDLSSYGWPLYVIIPGLTLLIVGFVSLGTGALVPGGIVTMTGLILAYAERHRRLGELGLRVDAGRAGRRRVWACSCRACASATRKQVRLGRTLMFSSALMFMIGFVFFESIFNIIGAGLRNRRAARRCRCC